MNKTRKYSVFFSKADNLLEYIGAISSGIFYGGGVGFIFAIVKNHESAILSASIGAAIGAAGGFTYTKLENMFRKKFGDDIPVILVLLLGCLALTAVLYFIV